MCYTLSWSLRHSQNRIVKHLLNLNYIWNSRLDYSQHPQTNHSLLKFILCFPNKPETQANICIMCSSPLKVTWASLPRWLMSSLRLKFYICASPEVRLSGQWPTGVFQDLTPLIHGQFSTWQFYDLGHQLGIKQVLVLHYKLSLVI